MAGEESHLPLSFVHPSTLAILFSVWKTGRCVIPERKCWSCATLWSPLNHGARGLVCAGHLGATLLCPQWIRRGAHACPAGHPTVSDPGPFHPLLREADWGTRVYIYALSSVHTCSHMHKHGSACMYMQGTRACMHTCVHSGTRTQMHAQVHTCTLCQEGPGRGAGGLSGGTQFREVSAAREQKPWGRRTGELFSPWPWMAGTVARRGGWPHVTLMCRRDQSPQLGRWVPAGTVRLNSHLLVAVPATPGRPWLWPCLGLCPAATRGLCPSPHAGPPVAPSPSQPDGPHQHSLWFPSRAVWGLSQIWACSTWICAAFGFFCYQVSLLFRSTVASEMKLDKSTESSWPLRDGSGVTCTSPVVPGAKFLLAWNRLRGRGEKAAGFLVCTEPQAWLEWSECLHLKCCSKNTLRPLRSLIKLRLPSRALSPGVQGRWLSH